MQCFPIVICFKCLVQHLYSINGCASSIYKSANVLNGMQVLHLNNHSLSSARLCGYSSLTCLLTALLLSVSDTSYLIQTNHLLPGAFNEEMPDSSSGGADASVLGIAVAIPVSNVWQDEASSHSWQLSRCRALDICSLCNWTDICSLCNWHLLPLQLNWHLLPLQLSWRA